MSWFRDYLPDRQLVLDASALINLLGCGAAGDVFKAQTGPCLLEERVIAEIRRHPIPGLCHEKALSELEESGFVGRTKMDVTEYSHFLSLVQAPLGQRLDSGESASLAVAHNRSLTVVLDENKARSFTANHLPRVTYVSTLCLFVSAAVRSGWSRSRLRELVTSARVNARMGVPREEGGLLATVIEEVVARGR